MWGALAIRLPSGSNSAQEKSSRSLMLTEWAWTASRAPICSAIDMNRLLKISSSTGSASVPTLGRAGTRPDPLEHEVRRRRSPSRRQPWVDHGGGVVSAMIDRAVDAVAGAELAHAGRACARATPRRRRSAHRHAGAGGVRRRRRPASPGPAAGSVATASTRQRLDDEGRSHQERVRAAVCGLELRGHGSGAASRTWTVVSVPS